MTLAPEQTRQLEILGYTDPESRVRVRCFVAKGMPLNEQLNRGTAWQKDEKTIIPIPIEGWLYTSGVFIRLKKKRSSDALVLDDNGNPIWREGKTYQDGIAYLQSLNVQGYGIYLIPNEGGGADADIERFPALFYECDGVSKDEQWQKLRSLESKLERKASQVVETRKSLHCYFKLVSGSVLPSTWTQYQQRLIQEQDSDPAIWNPARLMRLAGFAHQKWDTEQRSLIQSPVRLVQENDNTFTLNEFDQVLPEWDYDRWSRAYQTSERVATDPIGDPWDIRNFAHYLDGYRADGRRGWDTCKCPAHNGESDNSLHVEQSTGAYKCHSGCDPKDVYRVALEQALSRGYQLPEKHSTGHRFSTLGGWLFNIRQRLTKTRELRNAWGFGCKGEVEVGSTAATTFPAIEYQSGERLDVWAEAKKQGSKYILDISATGTGKSFDGGKATPELFEGRQLIYISDQHRNPTTPTLLCWSDLEARHKGLVRDEFGKLRRTKPGQPYIVSPNCSRNDTISTLRSKNIGGADTSGLICQTCSNLEPCQAGAVFGYLYDRAKSLRQPRLRAHPESLPDPAEYDYSDVVLVWDEVSEILKTHRSIDVTAQDLQRVIADLAVKLPQVFDALRLLLTALHPFLSGEQKQPSRYGWKNAQLKEALPKLDGIDVAAIREALTPDLDEFLNSTKEHGVDLADLPRGVRKQFSDSDAETSTHISNGLALNWLPDFLDVLLGNVIGSLRIQYGNLTITLPDQRQAEIIRAAAGNIFLDATASSEDLALVLGVEPSSILAVRQAIPDTSNLEIIQVATMGRLGVGSARSEFCQSRVDALINQITADTNGKVAVFDFKRHTSLGDGKRRWWTDSRGVNDFEDYAALALVGVPCRNLGDWEAEFAVLYGRPLKEGTERIKYPIQVNGQPSPDLQPWFEMEVSADPEFHEFCRRRILADIHQAIGRLRSHRRPGQQLRVYFIGDYPLDIPVTLKKASDITPEAATKTERVEIAIRGAVQKLKDAGQKITQQALAQIVGVTQGYISRFKKVLQTLLSNSNSQSNNFGEQPYEHGEQEWVIQKYLPLLAESPPDELLLGVLTTFEVYGQEVWRHIWDATPAAAQVKILQALMFTLSPGELRSLCIAAGVKV